MEFITKIKESNDYVSERRLLNVLAESILKIEDSKINKLNSEYLNLDNKLKQLSETLKNKNQELKNIILDYNKSKLHNEVFNNIYALKKGGLLTGGVKVKIKTVLDDIDNYSIKKLQEINDNLSRYNPKIKKILYE